MHLQIRKKEKYLLISMIGYLIIVSSALFLIFSSVQAYTLMNDYTMENTSYTFYTGDGTFRFDSNDNRTLISYSEYDGECKFSTDRWAGSQIFNGKLGTTGTYGNATVYYTADSYTKNVATICHIDIEWFNTAGDATSPSMYFIENTTAIFNNGIQFHAATALPDSPNMRIGSGNGMSGNYKIYSGTDTPDVPEITDFTVEKSCYNPNESAILHANVTGTVDTWNWKVYDTLGNVISETSDPVDTVTDPLNIIGSLAAKVTVTNEGGVDDYYKTGFINVTQPGECNFTPYNPFPTISVTPTQNVFVTMTMPPSVLVNMTGVNDVVNNSYLGNWSLAYRQDVDRIGEGFNTTLVGVVSIVQSPLTMVVNGIAEGVSLFSVSVNSLMSYTTIPLAIVGITLSYYPWQIITLITAGIAVDALFILIFGVR